MIKVGDTIWPIYNYIKRKKKLKKPVWYNCFILRRNREQYTYAILPPGMTSNFSPVLVIFLIWFNSFLFLFILLHCSSLLIYLYCNYKQYIYHIKLSRVLPDQKWRGKDFDCHFDCF